MTVSVARSIERNGYAIWRNFLSDEEIATYTPAASQLLTSHGRRLPRSTRVFDLHQYDALWAQLVCKSNLLEVVRETLGENALLSDLSLNSVERNGSPDKWHQDYPLNEAERSVEGALGLQCVLALTKFNAKTGATEIWHSQPPLDSESASESPISLFEAEPGDLLILRASTWHRAGTNQTNEPRVGVLLGFVERWIRPLMRVDHSAAEVFGPEFAALAGANLSDEIDGEPVY